VKSFNRLAKQALVLVLAGLTFGALAAPTVYQEILRLESLRSLGDGELAKQLASQDAQVASRAALAIGRTKQSAGEALLVAYVSDPRDGVRAMSVYGMGILATGQHGDVLLRALDDRSSAVRLAGVDAIARYQAAKRYQDAQLTAAEGALERELANDADPIVRGAAAIGLVEFRDTPAAASAGGALESAFEHDADLAVRERAMWAIYRGFALKVRRGAVEAALHDSDDVIRIEAVRAMARYTDNAPIALVQPLLADPSWRVQEQAAETIRVLSGKSLSTHLSEIPSFVHLPPRQPDPFAELAALPRPQPTGKPGAPKVDEAIYTPLLDPTSARRMTEPAVGMHPRVRIVTTKGNLYVALFPEWAPLTVENFLNLAQRGYYDNNHWFRIVPDFVVQTGDPKDNGDGDAGYAIGAEESPLQQSSYVISMGLNYDDKTQTPIRDSAGTQYYITLSPQFHLDRDFTVFGTVTAGFDVLSRLVESDRVLRIERLPDVALDL
jgi:cyclophilin family peptidyl-prolyl cis-trans isomerase/HEAT repeat protein